MIIKTFDLSKCYGKVRALEGLNLEVEEGEIFGFLGPNGAGKTTTIRLLLDFIRPTGGRAEVFGLDATKCSYQIRQRIGNIPGDVSLYEGMTGQHLLELMGSFHQKHDHQRQEELAHRLELDLSRKIRGYSKGMKQKLAIIQALMNNPELLILDEPTLGLDPLMQQEFYQILQEEQAKGKTTFMSSHILPEVERVCDRVGIIKDGHMVAVEEIAKLKRKKVRQMEITLAQEVKAEDLKLEGVEVLQHNGRKVTLGVRGHVDALIKHLAAYPIEDMVFPEGTLEDTFFTFYADEPRQ